VTILDERGRIAGRFNVVDVCAAIVLLLLLPLAVAAYLLFRTPAPTLATVTPATLFEGGNQRIEIDGTNLRPFMRVSFNTTPANSFLLGSTKYALVDLPALRPGVYDVVLYDYAREVARLPKALTVAAPAPDVSLELVGRFEGIADMAATALKAGDHLPSGAQPVATIVSIGSRVPGALRLRVGDETIAVPSKRQDIEATLLVSCSTQRNADGAVHCVVPMPDQPVVVAPDALLTFATPSGPLVFQISAARAPKP
jgi:hypothetical protein